MHTFAARKLQNNVIVTLASFFGQLKIITFQSEAFYFLGYCKAAWLLLGRSLSWQMYLQIYTQRLYEIIELPAKYFIQLLYADQMQILFKY